jgi:hypothetical protein
MWTADEDDYRKAILDMTDYYLDLTDKTAKAFRSQSKAGWTFWPMLQTRLQA